MKNGLQHSGTAPGRHLPTAALLSALVLIWGCDGDDGSDGKDGKDAVVDTSTNTELEVTEVAPGVNIAVLSVDGASGNDGTFQVGDTIEVTYTVTKDDATAWGLDEFSRGRILVSGPTSNYQRVIEEQSDLAALSETNSDGSHTYTFAYDIPATYLPPINDTASFGPGDGELTGMPLLAGTYTVGLYFRWSYTVEEDSFRQAGNATADFLFGGAQALDTRAVVGQANCNQCHDDLRVHGGMRKDVTLCLMCHTSGSEDGNNPAVAGGTPGTSIDFDVMIHRIHNGAHLPSVMGMETNPDGTRNYAGTPTPYLVLGHNDSIHDYSEIAFPVWPSLSNAMPRDTGYSALGSTEQGMENTQRLGVVACATCHGDPDGAGPIGTPAQGSLAMSNPTRRACGSCHDDIDWDLPYTANQSTMPAQASDATCMQCHGVMGSALDVMDAHRHPLVDPNVNPGLHFDLLSVVEAGTNDGDGTIDPGEKVAMTFTVTDDMGLDVDPGDISSLSAVLNGPTSNLNLVQSSSLPTGALTGAQPYTVHLPMKIDLYYTGDSTAGLDTFTTDYTPHWDPLGATTTVYVRASGGGGFSTLSAAAPAPTNYIDVVDPTGLDRDDIIVIDDDVVGREEYLEIQYVDGNRIWFASPYQSDYKPGTRVDHALGATVAEVTIEEKTAGVDYTLDASIGEIVELSEFGTGREVIVTYTTDFVMPDTYPLTLNTSPDVTDAWGKWTGKSLVDGTYRQGLWGYRSLSLMLHGETNNYRAASEAAIEDVLVGSATEIEPYDLISSLDNCLSCHQDIYFHGSGRRGVESCVQCHGLAGAEDRPVYRAANAPDTTENLVKFRTMIHKLHMGEELANASTYSVIGYGNGYPNNFSVHTYEEVVFPTMPGAAQHCQKCHGDENTSWLEPNQLTHPTEQVFPSRSWRAACGACHDSDEEQAHIDLQTSSTLGESCTICHEEGTELGVDVVHRPRY